MQSHVRRQRGEVQRIHTFVRILRHLIGFCSGCRREQIRIIVQPTNQQIVTSCSVEPIVSSTARQSIPQTIASQIISAGTTNRVLNRAAGIELQCPIRVDRLYRRSSKMQSHVRRQCGEVQRIYTFVRILRYLVRFTDRGYPKQVLITSRSPD